MVNKKYELLVVCGLHRSGTTYIGRMLSCLKLFPVIHEPFNMDFGIKNVPVVYPYIEDKDDVNAQLVQQAIAFQCVWNKESGYLTSSRFRKSFYAITGGRSGIRWDFLRLRKWLGMLPDRVCWKDPFVTLAMPYLVRETDAKVICMVRHPAAIHHSTEKKGWNFNINNLLMQKNLVVRYGADIPESHWELAKKNNAASIAILWKFMVRINIPLSQKHNQILIITHEELCQHPTQIASDICNHFQLPITPKLIQYVKQHSEGGRVEAKDNKTHDFKRNSRALIDNWRGKISSEDEDIIRDIVGDEVIKLYGKW